MQVDGPGANKKPSQKHRQDQCYQRWCDEYELSGLPVDAQTTQQGRRQQDGRQHDEMQEFAISLYAVFHFRWRNSLSVFRSFQTVSVPCSSSAFNSAAVCICRFGSSTTSVPFGARLIARMTASNPCLKSALS